MSKKVIASGLLAGALMLIVGMVLNQIYGLVFPSLADEYINAQLFRPWSDPLMSLYFLHPFILGVVLSWVWDKTKKLIDGKTLWDRAYKFGLAYLVIAGIPGMFITYSSFQVSLTMVGSWLLSGLLQALLAGWVFAKRNP